MARSSTNEVVECWSSDRLRLWATVELVPTRSSNGSSVGQEPLLVVTEDEAARFGEETVQLLERERYEYRLTPAAGVTEDLSLLEEQGIQHSRVVVPGDRGERGLVEPQDYCGLLTLTVIRRGDQTAEPVATGSVEVRSRKLGYRDHYRGMLSHIAEKCAGLLLDCRAPTHLRLSSLWSRDSRFLEQQMEFLRSTLESPAFAAALSEVLRNPHRRLEGETREVPISRPFKPGREFGRQIAIGSQRILVPASNPLSLRIKSLPERVFVESRIDFLDTAENRFVKMLLREFRDFLADVSVHLARQSVKQRDPGSGRLLREAERLRGMLETQLGRGFLPDVADSTAPPLGSPVLQRKAGYRELLRYWLQFHAGAQLDWEGGPDVFAAGSRNVPTLYEYWLFFQLEALFRQRFDCEQPLHAIVIDRSKAPPQMVLKRGVELETPVAGVWSKSAGRNLRADFRFNQKFGRREDRSREGSWTRGVQPDYTISLWPAEYSRAEAEDNELMVHVHFDAKYRVERVRELLGDASDDEAFKTSNEPEERAPTLAKYADLLKMHAYRDAVRRTAGAYVLYPGEPGDGQKYQGYHEVLPGLGAFAIRPDKEGRPEGIAALATFLDNVIEHLANRTTSRERLTYHASEAYSLREDAVPYDSLHLPEGDTFGPDFRALPPAEDMVLLAWYENAPQLDLARAPNGLMYVRLGRRQGALRVHPNLARVRRLILHTHGQVVARGALKLREPGFEVFTRAQLRLELRQHAAGKGVAAWEAAAGADDDEFLYALFRTSEDETFAGQQWLGDVLLDQIERFESDARNKPVKNVGRTSPDPRVLRLRDVLAARA